MSFASLKLHPKIQSAIVDSGYLTPTPIQAQAIPIIMSGQDLVASAQTGTGKTAAFVLPILHRLETQLTQHRKPRILILTPTRELSQQVTTAASQYGKHMRFTAASIVGGMSYRQQQRSISRPLDMLIATPGRLMDWMARPNVLDLSNIEVLVLDEADRMLDMGFIDDVEHIVRHIGKATRYQKRQTLLFSATLDDRISKLAKNILETPASIQVTPTKTSHANIEQRLYVANDPAHKVKILDYLLSNEPIHQAIIFSATKSHAEKFANELRRRGHAAGALHGDMKQNQRNRMLDDLRSGKVQLLVATDVAARGIDVKGITHVINYDLPKFAEDYVHRIGRTGRAGQTGIAISLAIPSDGRFLQGIERYTGQTIKQFTIPGLEPTTGLHQRGAPGKGGKKRPGGGKFKGKPSSKSGGFKTEGFKKPGGGFKAKSRGPKSAAPAGTGQFKKKRKFARAPKKD